MPWPFPEKKESADPNNAEAASGEGGAPAKTPAELIAESVSAALKPLTDSMAALSTKVDAVEAATKRPAKVENTEPRARTSVFDDEDAAINERVYPLAERTLALEARMARNEVKIEYATKGYGEVWAQFEADINTVLENSPLVDGSGKLCRGDAGYIRNCVNMIFGKAAMAAGLKFGGKDKGFFIESAGGEVGGGGGSVTVDDGMTEGQRKVFNRMKGPDGKPITVDAAKKTLGKLKFIN